MMFPVIDGISRTFAGLTTATELPEGKPGPGAGVGVGVGVGAGVGEGAGAPPFCVRIILSFFSAPGALKR